MSTDRLYSITRLPILFGAVVWALVVFAEAATDPQQASTIYSPFGKRDPFQVTSDGISRGISSLNPLERFSITQFRLKAIVRSATSTTAMFVDPSGLSHLLKEGDVLGREGTLISRILVSDVILTQKTMDYLGNESLTERIVSLPEEDRVLLDGISRDQHNVFDERADGGPKPEDVSFGAKPGDGVGAAIGAATKPVDAPTRPTGQNTGEVSRRELVPSPIPTPASPSQPAEVDGPSVRALGSVKGEK